ncbi:MAG: hypothetical protein ACE5JP_07415 [Candidatus Bipolaricaulia bacterium]
MHHPELLYQLVKQRHEQLLREAEESRIAAEIPRSSRWREWAARFLVGLGLRLTPTVGLRRGGDEDEKAA